MATFLLRLHASDLNILLACCLNIFNGPMLQHAAQLNPKPCHVVLMYTIVAVGVEVVVRRRSKEVALTSIVPISQESLGTFNSASFIYPEHQSQLVVFS